MVGRDLYYRVTHANGKSHVEHTRVWDADRFLESQRAAGANAKKEEDRFTISPATEADYKAQRKAVRT